MGRSRRGVPVAELHVPGLLERYGIMGTWKAVDRESRAIITVLP